MNKKKKNNKKRVINKNIILFISLVVLIFTLIIFVLFIFPYTIINKIKDQLILYYKPISYLDKNNLTILKLEKEPADELNLTFYDNIYNKYNLETKFEQIDSIDSNKGIKKISFYKNNTIYFEFNEFYLFWDIKLSNQNNNNLIEDNNNIKSIKNNIICYHKKVNENKKVKEINNNSTIIKEKKDNSRFNNKLLKISNNKKEYPFPEKKSNIVIIIDDVGYNSSALLNFLSIGVPVTFAIIPELPNSKNNYNLIKKYNYDIILHIPMEPIKGKKYVEKNAILSTMSKDEIESKIDYMFNEYPEVSGANNHMGSKIVSDIKSMNIIIGELAKRNKIWVDSMTNKDSVSKEISSLYDIKYFERDVFLDNYKDIDNIKKSMEQLIKISKEKGFAIGIGHIQSINLPLVLKEYYEKKDLLNIEFIFLKDLN